MRKPFNSTLLGFFLAGFLLLARGPGSLLAAAKPPEKLKISGSNAERFRKAVELEDQQQYDQAIREYKAYLKARPFMPYTYYYLGNLYCELGQTRQGEEQFRKAAGLRPG